MVNNKKMSKSTVAVVVLALLLVLSLVLSATGAWFSDIADGKGSTLTFGEIDIEVGEESYAKASSATYLKDVDIMPGDVINGSVEVENLREAAYLKVSFTATCKAGDAALTLKNFKQDNTDATLTEGVAYLEVAQATDASTPKTTTLTFDIELTGGAFDNDYQAADIVITVKVEAIQKANIELGEDKTYKTIAEVFTAITPSAKPVVNS